MSNSSQIRPRISGGRRAGVEQARVDGGVHRDALLNIREELVAVAEAARREYVVGLVRVAVRAQPPVAYQRVGVDRVGRHRARAADEQRRVVRKDVSAMERRPRGGWLRRPANEQGRGWIERERGLSRRPASEQRDGWTDRERDREAEDTPFIRATNSPRKSSHAPPRSGP
jgi:hypothetical protein